MQHDRRLRGSDFRFFFRFLALHGDSAFGSPHRWAVGSGTPTFTNTSYRGTASMSGFDRFFSSQTLHSLLARVWAWPTKHLVSPLRDGESARISYPLNKVCAVVLLSLAVPATADAQPCRTQSLSGAFYLVCSFDLTRDDLRTYWRGDDGKPYR